MNRARKFVRQTLTIAQRDLVATVATPTFLFFLLSPIIMLSFGFLGGMGASSLSGVDKERIVAIAPVSDAGALRAADKTLRDAVANEDGPPALSILEPSADPEAQAHAAFAGHGNASAVLYGPLAHPTILYGGQGGSDSRYLAALAEDALRIQHSKASAPLSTATRVPLVRQTTSASGHSQAASFTVFGIFFLTLMLAGQVVGTMAEERNNKVVEVLAASVPLEAAFLGKLIGMFGSAVLFVAFWGTLVSQVHAIAPPGLANALGEIGPAIGMPVFVPLFFAYFSMTYLLLGSVFLGIGAQATTPRELQMLSLPITIAQMLILGLTLRAAAHPDSSLALAAEIFPFSSPYAMAAHAANSPELWPHLAALAWQAMWVGIVIFIAARAFRRGVLKSGSPRPSWMRRNGKSAAIDKSVS